MRKIIFIIVFAIVSFVQAQEVRATVSSNNIQLSDVFTFKIEAINANKNPDVNLAPLLNDFSIVSGPAKQTNMQWINGKSTSSRSLSWSLVAKQEGQSTIPQLTVNLGKNVFLTQPIVMTISESDAGYESTELFMTIDVDKDQAYVGEQITVTYKLFTRVNMSVQSVDFPKHSGFWTEELFVPQQVDFKDVVLEGVNYKVATLYRIALFPTKSGNLELVPMTMNCNVVTKSKSNSFFNDPFFGSFGNQSVPKVLRSKHTVINVREFPGEIPDSFTGAVGDFKITSSIMPENVKANNAITFKIQFKGTGNIDIFALPEMQFPQNIEVFPPTLKTEKEPFRDQITGTISKDYILIPRKTGRYTIPKIEIAYFNPKVREWRSTSTQPIDILVDPDDNIASGVIGYSKEEVELLGEDIRYIRANTIKWKRDSNPYLTYGIYMLSLILLILPSLVFKIHAKRLSTEDLRRSKSALRMAFKKLRKSKGDHFSNISNSVYGYLKDKLQLTSDKLAPLEVRSILRDKISDNSVIDNIVELLKTCDAGRFAPGDDVSRQKLIKRTKVILKRLNAIL
ncbi:MAG: BatD family protein [Candidatus Neomarinimicrobiota bacterium]